MRADPRLQALALGALLLLAARPAGAQAIGGTLSGQWQRVEERLPTIAPDGTVQFTTFARTFWSQSYELRHTTTFARQFNISSQLQYLDQSYTARPHSRRVGGATLRIGHPVFALTASYRPTLLTTTPVSLGIPGTAVYRTLRTRIQETIVAGNFAVPGLPRLDLSWTRQRHENEGRGTEEASVTRNAQLAYAAGPLDVHAGYGDQGRDSTGGTRAVVERWNGTAGAGLRLAPTPALSFGMLYDFSNYRTGAQAPGGLTTRVHAGSVNGSYRISERAGWDLAYAYRRTQLQNHVENRLASHDGSLLFRYVPGRATSFNVAGGVHTLNSSNAPQTERFLSATAATSGRVRTAWSGSATASHSTNWDVAGRAYSIETARLGSTFRGSRDFQLGVDVSGSLNSNPTLGTGRVVTEAAVSAAAAPIRSVRLTLASRITRSGPTFFDPFATSGNRSLTLRWAPGRRVDLDGALDRSESGGPGRTQTTTRRARLNLQPGARTRVSASYSRSDNLILQAATSQLIGREVYSAEFTHGFGRGWTLRADTFQVDPNGRNSSQQYDAGLTLNFGR